MNFDKLYRSKVTDIDTALSYIKSGSRVYLGGGAGVPIELMRGMTSGRMRCATSRSSTS